MQKAGTIAVVFAEHLTLRTNMTDADQLKTFAAVADISRKWVTVLDTKAGFLIAIDGALMTFIWASAKLVDSVKPWCASLALISSGAAAISLLFAAYAVFPRIRLDTKPSVQPYSFFVHVAQNYPEQDGSRFADDVLSLSDAQLIRETLEQHHAISHVAMLKNGLVTTAAGWWFAALIICVISVFLNRG